MSVVGDVLPNPDDGWARYDDRDERITYSAGWTLAGETYYYNGTRHFYAYGSPNMGWCSFSFFGTKFRLISGHSPCNIEIDGVHVGVTSAEGACVLVYEIDGLERKVHTVKISNATQLSSNTAITVDAFDIDADGHLCELDGSCVHDKYLVKIDSSVYTITDGVLDEINETITKDVINDRGIALDVLNDNLNLLSDEFSILSNIENNLEIIGVKSKKELVVALNDFHTIVQENIDYFKCESEKVGNGQIKIVFSIDGGSVWKSHNGTNFVDLGIEIPMKEFELLSSEELDKWNSSKEEILISGIDVDVLETLDFNILDFDKIRFAYAISVDATDDVAVNKNLIWQFDSKGSMQKLKDSEYDLNLHSNGVKFKSLIDADMVKVNILPNGVNVSEDTDFATDSDIDDMFS